MLNYADSQVIDVDRYNLWVAKQAGMMSHDRGFVQMHEHIVRQSIEQAYDKAVARWLEEGRDG